jgi:hypothetical protein
VFRANVNYLQQKVKYSIVNYICAFRLRCLCSRADEAEKIGDIAHLKNGERNTSRTLHGLHRQRPTVCRLSAQIQLKYSTTVRDKIAHNIPCGDAEMKRGTLVKKPGDANWITLADPRALPILAGTDMKKKRAGSLLRALRLLRPFVFNNPS